MTETGGVFTSIDAVWLSQLRHCMTQTAEDSGVLSRRADMSQTRAFSGRSGEEAQMLAGCHPSQTMAFIGTGKVGAALSRLYYSLGYEISAVACRRGLSAELTAAAVNCRVLSVEQAAAAADIVWLAVPDREIAPVAAQIAASGLCRPEQLFIHLSGALAVTELQPLQQTGAQILALHPLYSFGAADGKAPDLGGTLFCADFPADAAVQAGSQAAALVQAVDGELVIIDSALKPLYHAAAVFVSNYLVTLVQAGLTLQKSCGLTAGQGEQGLLRLLEATLHNIKQGGAVQALTGPIERGDGEVLQKHISSMRAYCPELLPLYRELAFYTINIAVAKGSVDQQQRADMQEIIERENNNERK